MTGEEGQPVAEDRVGDVVVGDAVVERTCGDRRRDHDDEVEEELQGGRDAMLLAAIAPAHGEDETAGQ